MRYVLAALALAAVAAGCGSAARKEHGTPAAGTLEALWRKPGQDVAIVPGTSDFAPGVVRLSFLVVTRDSRVIKRPRARVWIAGALRAKPFGRVTARLEPIGVPGVSEGHEHDVTHLYVAHVRVPRPGKYWVLAEPIGGERIQAIGNVVAKRRTESPPVGAKAPPSETPTIASVGGDFSRLTTRRPPDRALLRYSIADSLREHAPFVVVFATPRFCTSRTCGPVVDVTEAARRRYAHRGIRFIHVEIYEDNNPQKGYNRWVREWNLVTEPWVFLVGADGRIKAKFEGSVSLEELSTTVRAELLR